MLGTVLVEPIKIYEGFPHPLHHCFRKSQIGPSVVNLGSGINSRTQFLLRLWSTPFTAATPQIWIAVHHSRRKLQIHNSISCYIRRNVYVPPLYRTWRTWNRTSADILHLDVGLCRVSFNEKLNLITAFSSVRILTYSHISIVEQYWITFRTIWMISFPRVFKKADIFMFLPKPQCFLRTSKPSNNHEASSM